jgi:acetyl-CoA carboxylase alpha subunit
MSYKEIGITLEEARKILWPEYDCVPDAILEKRLLAYSLLTSKIVDMVIEESKNDELLNK